MIANESRAPLTVCGDMAGSALAIPLLIGLGYRHLSVAPPSLPLVKEVVRRLRRDAAEALVLRCLEAETTEAVEGLVRDTFGKALEGLERPV